MSKYTPLHVHSDFSIGDSILSIEEYVNFAKANGFEAIAVTDHGSMSASFNLNSGCKAAGIKSILGIEAYCMTKEEFADKTNHSRQHMILLAKNLNGYKNLLKIHGLALRDTFYYRPVIMYEDLFENKQDIIVLSGHHCTVWLYCWQDTTGHYQR